MSTPFYLTTAIYYANAAPHIGHAYEIIAADVTARYQRLAGKNVYFLTGMDEHGVKVQKTAEAQGISPKQFVDGIAETFKTAWQQLQVTENRFIRTTDAQHYEVVKNIWLKLQAKGDIYKARYEAQYCKGCELFLTERDKDAEGKCLIHGVMPEAVTEENYFFKLTAYKDKIKNLIQTHPDFIQPQSRVQEVLNQLEDVTDISISRAKSAVSWGIPVPGDDDQVIYVWIDALSNYLTGVNWSLADESQYQTFWPPTVQVIGKDILRFHAIYWPAMLIAAELPLPKTLLVHGFIRLADNKLSKSTGNILGVQDLMERFELINVDPIRYYLIASCGFGQDGNYSDDEFKLKINADLANNLGNLLNRTLTMCKKYTQGQVPQTTTQSLVSVDDLNAIQTDFEQFQYNEACNKILGLVDKGNKAINDGEPWKLFGQERFDEVNAILYNVLDILRQAAILLSPITPLLSQNIWQQLGYTTEITQAQWPDLTQKPIPFQQILNPGSPVLPRLESEIVGAGKKG